MNWLKQVVAVTFLNIRSIPQRLGSSLVGMVGIAGVVIVLIAVLSIAEGFTAAMEGTGADDRALVMRSGADSEMTSGLGGPETDIILQAPGIAMNGQQPIASRELYVIIALPARSTGGDSNVPMRGVSPAVFDVRQTASLVEGRMLLFGTNEVVVGRGAAGQFAGLDLGAELRVGQVTWKVVGIFEDDGSVAETEIWGDARTLQGVYRRGNSFQSVLVRLQSPQAFDELKNFLTSNPQVNVSVRRESEYYAAQSVTLSTLIRTIGFTIAGLMALGAVFGAVLTMYTAVATRTREIATLRALGFSASAVLTSVLAESIALATVGGLFGGLAAYAAFNGYQTSTMNFQTFSQVAFAFRVTTSLLLTGLTWALLMGLMGGLFPALRAARLPISKALREL